jgi:hypothetical protein
LPLHAFHDAAQHEHARFVVQIQVTLGLEPEVEEAVATERRGPAADDLELHSARWRAPDVARGAH